MMLEVSAGEVTVRRSGSDLGPDQLCPTDLDLDLDLHLDLHLDLDLDHRPAPGVPDRPNSFSG